jgi:hypothetical protein
LVRQHPNANQLYGHRFQARFFGGYDHTRQAGFVHVANHTSRPASTWGNHEFGYATDRHLTQ